MELKWIVKEEIVFGDFLNFLAWMSESNKAFFKLFLEALCNMELLQCGCSCVSDGSPLEQEILCVCVCVCVCGVYICIDVCKTKIRWKENNYGNLGIFIADFTPFPASSLHDIKPEKTVNPVSCFNWKWQPNRNSASRQALKAAFPQAATSCDGLKACLERGGITLGPCHMLISFSPLLQYLHLLRS